MNGILAIFLRDIKKFFRDNERVIFAIGSPFILLVVFGSSMSGAMNSIIGGARADSAIEGFSYARFMFPGIIAITIFNSAMSSALSLVQDRELGFLNVILVSPISRWKIALGKIFSGTAIALIEGIILFLFAPFTNTKLTFIIIIDLLPLMIIVALAVSSIAILLATFIKSIQAFQAITGFSSMVVVFLSGAFIPMNGMPRWIEIVAKLNPLTYAVDMMRKVVVNIDALNPAARIAFGLDLTIFGKQLILVHEQFVLIIVTLFFLILATVRFTTAEYS